MHTFVKYLHNNKHEVWAVGYFVGQMFVPLFDVETQTDALVAVQTLNGGGPTQSVTILRTYSGIAPHPEIPSWEDPESETP